ncbi:hypothetical protein F5Y01DRAFT_319741 [Xylaria sp. FL0043]|nr:hypothetical protein F5Y01DRAFT_319741 [Xylaria sp. FL0043]
MPLFNQSMDTDLLQVGSWADDRALNQSSTSWPRPEAGAERRIDPGIENPGTKTHHPEPWSDRIEQAKSSRQFHQRRHPKSKDELLDWPSRNARKEVRATQTTQRPDHCYPACFVKGEERQQGNKATSKLPGSLSKVERRLLKQASAPFLLDGLELRIPKLDWSVPRAEPDIGINTNVNANTKNAMPPVSSSLGFPHPVLSVDIGRTMVDESVAVLAALATILDLVVLGEPEFGLG